AEAYVKGLASDRELQDQLARNSRKPGRGALRAFVERTSQPALTQSEAERLLLDLVRKAGLPEPEVNVRVGSVVVDFLWRSRRVIAELDGYAFHSHVMAFGTDRRRTYALHLEGYLFLRFTWPHLVEYANGSI